MSTESLVTRREFTLEAALAILSGVTITVGGCGSKGPNAPSQSGGRTGTVSANHGHRAVIAAAQLTTPTSLSLDIRGDADHPHTVQLTQAEVTQIGAGQRVSKQSSTDAFHDHTVTFN